MNSNTLELFLLGEFDFMRGGRHLSIPRSKKARLLVAHLALNAGQSLIREELAAHLWPDQELESARFNLRQLVASLRREAPDLSPLIIAEDRQTLRFEPGECVIDAQLFQRLGASDPEQAVALYRGPLLASLDDDWLSPVRSELDELYSRALETLAEKAAPRDAIRWLRRALEADPYREQLQQKLMSRLAECGDAAAVHAAFRSFQDLLHRELNLSPAPETAQLYRELTKAPRPIECPPTPSVPRSKLPVPATRLFGRECEIAEVRAILCSNRLVTLLGPGGAGKTRLSIAVGEEELEERCEGVWFVDLSAVSDAALVPQTVGHELGFRGPVGPDWTDALVEMLRQTEWLLIFDNCEHLVGACAGLVDKFVARCPGVTILATSRMPLGAEGEQRFYVPPLNLPIEGGERDPDARYSALELFEARARLVAPKFSVSDQNVAAVSAICAQVDAMPLGIEMAAARLAALPLQEVARRLDDRLNFLKLQRGVAPRHQTLGAVIEWSYELLSDDERCLLARLSIFSGGWTVQAAEAVCGYGEPARSRVLDALVGWWRRLLHSAVANATTCSRPYVSSPPSGFPNRTITSKPSIDTPATFTIFARARKKSSGKKDPTWLRWLSSPNWTIFAQHFPGAWPKVGANLAFYWLPRRRGSSRLPSSTARRPHGFRNCWRSRARMRRLLRECLR